MPLLRNKHLSNLLLIFMVLTPYFLGSDAGYSLHLFKQSIKLANFPVNQFSRGPEEWRNRTIYQLLTDRFAQPKSNQNTTLCASNRNEYEIRRYCGGTFVGIAEKLDYIKDLGFDAIWISPVVKQFEKETQWGVGWHGYWAQDLYTINEHFGTKKDLKRLVAEAHKKGIWVMVDVVANHMGPQRGLIPGTKQYVESYIPFNRTNHYHDYCVIGNDWDNQYKVEHCSLGGEDLPLPDLDTENPQVVNILNEWVAKLVKTYNFDGIRIDTVRHVRKDFWDGFTRSAGVFSIGEIYNQNSQYVSLYQAHLDSALNYPLFDVIAWENGVFRNPEKRIWDLRNRINENRQWFRDTTVLGNFFDSHDQPRFLSRTQDKTLFRNVITFTLLADGIPIIYQGTEQDFAGNPNVPNGGNDPWNREALWSAQYNLTSPTSIFIANINKFRKILPSSFYKSLLVEAWIDEHVYMFLKDRVLVLVSNLGSGAKDQGGISKRSINVYTQERWDRGTEVVNVLWCYERFTVDDSGFVKIGNVNGEAKVLYPVKQLTGTGICNL